MTDDQMTEDQMTEAPMTGDRTAERPMGAAVTAGRLPEVFTGTHDNLDGADGHTPWPDDVPPDQDDTWYPLRDDPWKARRMEYIIAGFWAITALCGIGLMIVYWTGGQAQFEGALLLLAFASLGMGLLLWARYLLPGHDITASRGHHVSDPEERAAIVGSLSRGTEAMMSRRGFLGEQGPGAGGRDLRRRRHMAARLPRHPSRRRLVPHQVVPRARGWSPKTATPCTLTTSWWTGCSRCSRRGT